jgi:hypothetical protein
VLRGYDEKKKDVLLLEEIPRGIYFKTKKTAAIFKKVRNCGSAFAFAQKKMTRLVYLI